MWSSEYGSLIPHHRPVAPHMFQLGTRRHRCGGPQYACRHAHRACALWRAGITQVAVWRLVQRCHTGQQHGSWWHTRVRVFQTAQNLCMVVCCVAMTLQCSKGCSSVELSSSWLNIWVWNYTFEVYILLNCLHSCRMSRTVFFFIYI